MMFLDVFRPHNKALRSACGGPMEFIMDIPALKSALEAGADPDICVIWKNTVVGGDWELPALVATTLGKGSLVNFTPKLDVQAADLLLASGANPNKRWKGASLGLGWSFSQWVYETGCQEGWDLLKRHHIDPSPALSARSVKRNAGYELPMASMGRDAVRAEMSGMVIACREAVELENTTPDVRPRTRVSRL
jgi:hypothetical protein